MTDDPRAALERLARDNGDDFAGLSRMVGKNAAYIQQYIRRGTPRRLDEEVRRRLASYFGVAESVLGGPALAPGSDLGGLVRIDRLDVGASAGPGAFADDGAAGSMAFSAAWLKRLGVRPRDLSMIRVQGDSMADTLNDGDDILVDASAASAPLRDGIHVFRADGELFVKRIAMARGGRVTVVSDSDAYPDWPDVDPAALDILGRVVWAGRAVR